MITAAVREVDSNGSDDDINISMDERALIVLFAAATDVDNAVADCREAFV